MVPHPALWFDAWIEAATGADGFWAGSRPAEHFATAVAVGPELAEAVRVLLRSFPDIVAVVDVGAGDGALLSALAATRPPYELVGVDVRPRPAGLPDEVGWLTDCWDVRADRWINGAVPELLGGLCGPALLVATEWLDDLPCRVAVGRPGGLRELTADGTAGPPLAAEDQAWVDEWWPEGDSVETGLVEVGATRDRAWATLLAALAPVGGLGLAVDYGHVKTARPGLGSLAGFRAGRPAAAFPDRRANLTAAVAVDALMAAGERAGTSTQWCRRQADVVGELADLPHDEDPLQELAARSRRAALGRTGDWGSHWWLLQRVDPPTL
ncbi:hypothetical protein [uncultured Friedmanniella sp.]|uniref:hypothetical protein n=1 Tax=uncultured Friedmanniella sp. TaxID=335381 RepID=UPI0035CBD0CF